VPRGHALVLVLEYCAVSPDSSGIAAWLGRFAPTSGGKEDVPKEVRVCHRSARNQAFPSCANSRSIRLASQSRASCDPEPRTCVAFFPKAVDTVIIPDHTV
jgi:hypothetical protein